DDRMRLAAADLHHRPGLRGGPVDVVEQASGQLRVAELLEVLHRVVFRPTVSPAARSSVPAGRGIPDWVAARPQWSPNSASSSPICRKSSRVSSADCSSRRWRANPTCTIVYSPTWRSGA